MKPARAVIFAALFLLGFISSANAQDVTLISPDNQVEINGTLLGFDGEFYRVDTIYGELTVDGSGVRCEGPACPNLEDFVAELAISGEASVGAVLLPALIESFAQRAGLRVRREELSMTETRFELSQRSSGKVTGLFTVRATNTDEGFADLLANEADIVMSLREVRENEARLAQEAGLGDPFGIGLSNESETGDARAVPLSGNCGFILSAERKTVKTEDYPLTAPIFLYLPARRLPKLARDFLTFTRGTQAQLVIRRAGYTDQAPELVPIDVQGNRFANAIAQAGEEVTLDDLQRMASVLMPMKRLTTTFRFEVGSARLDAQSRSNVEQLALSLEAGQYDTHRLVFVGFSDGEGPAKANLAIAQRRAEAVREAVIAAAETANFERLKLDVDAFGEAMPMACDDSAWGRQVNRRVEVWVQHSE